MLYQGTGHGWKGDRDVSPEWCAGMVQGSSRLVEYPLPDRYSLGVMKRIVRGAKPRRTIAQVLGWPAKVA